MKVIPLLWIANFITNLVHELDSMHTIFLPVLVPRIDTSYWPFFRESQCNGRIVIEARLLEDGRLLAIR